MLAVTADGPRPADGVMLSGDGGVPVLWEIVGGDLELRRPRRASVPGGFSPYRFLHGRGLVWDGRLRDGRSFPDDDLLSRTVTKGLAPLRLAVTDRLDLLFPPGESRLLQSVLLGQRTEGIHALRNAYATVGLGHLFAVSGLHVGLVAGILFLLLRAFRAGRLVTLFALGLFLVVYILLVGMPGSSLRAGALLIMTAMAGWAGRAHDGLRTLGLLLWCWALAMPGALADSGLRLSFGAAAGIIVTLRLLSPLLRERSRVSRWLGNALAVSVGAQLGALPETARSFGWLHPLATLFNLIAVPSFSAAVWLAATALLTPIAWLAEALAALSWLILRVLSAGASLLAGGMDWRIGLPLWGPQASTAYVCGLAGLGLLSRGRSMRWRVIGAAGSFALLAIPMLGRTLNTGDMTAVQFDVGQGDCALLMFPDRSTILIDTGEAWRNSGPFMRDVRPWLRREGVNALDGVILTHAHSDHDGAAHQLAEAMPVDIWWLGGATQPPPGAWAVHPTPGDTLHQAGEWSLVCVASSVDEPSENDRSLAVALSKRGRIRGLWTGDLELLGERHLLRHVSNWPEAGIEILKAGHHGSRTSSSQEFLEAVHPGVVLVSCGIENRHKHPSHGPFLCLDDTLPVYRTDLGGTLFVRWRDEGPPEIEPHAGCAAQRLDTAPGGA